MTGKTSQRAELDSLPSEAREALQAVRTRVGQDTLPLLSLLQINPLQMQSSHLSFQEYYAARALCEEGTTLSGVPPWKWPAWWANAVELGAQMGESFGCGLMRAAGVTCDELNLYGKLSGDMPTAAHAVMLMPLKSLDLACACPCDGGAASTLPYAPGPGLSRRV